MINWNWFDGNLLHEKGQLNSVKCCFKQSTLSRCDGDNHKKIYFYSHVSGKCLEVKPGYQKSFCC